jgi:ATP-dependent Zn protease
MVHLLVCFYLATALNAGILEDLIIIGKRWTDYNRRNVQELIDAFNKPNDFFDPNRFDTGDLQNPGNGERRYTRDDIAGGIQTELLDLLNEEARREKNKELGVKPVKGILLYGPPGTGKTLCARVLAGEMNAHFIAASGSQFVEIWAGNGPKRVRELFDQAKQALLLGAPKVIIFIDEIDAIGGARSLEQNSEYRNTLNELLSQMDGFAKNDKIIVIGATNYIENIDSALKRPGRFDRLIEIKLPDYDQRRDIAQHYIIKIKFMGSLDIVDRIADQTVGFSQAELEGIINEAAMIAARNDADAVLDEHIEEALKIAHVQHRKR